MKSLVNMYILQRLNFKKERFDLVLKSENLDFIMMKFFVLNDLCHNERYKIVENEKIIFSNIDWKWISRQHSLSEDFIREFKDVLDWGLISHYQTLSVNFIIEFKKKVWWQAIHLNHPCHKKLVERLTTKNFKLKKEKRSYA